MAQAAGCRPAYPGSNPGPGSIRRSGAYSSASLRTVRLCLPLANLEQGVPVYLYGPRIRHGYLYHYGHDHDHRLALSLNMRNLALDESSENTYELVEVHTRWGL